MDRLSGIPEVRRAAIASEVAEWEAKGNKVDVIPTQEWDISRIKMFNNNGNIYYFSENGLRMKISRQNLRQKLLAQDLSNEERLYIIVSQNPAQKARELGEILQINASTVREIMKRLEAKGKITIGEDEYGEMIYA